jgi:hypothetical protein
MLANQASKTFNTGNRHLDAALGGMSASSKTAGFLDSMSEKTRALIQNGGGGRGGGSGGRGGGGGRGGRGGTDNVYTGGNGGHDRKRKYDYEYDYLSDEGRYQLVSLRPPVHHQVADTINRRHSPSH